MELYYIIYWEELLRLWIFQVVAGLAMVRNSVGSECYVADEIVTSRAGVRVRVGNTDAEGRMAMTDVLCYMKEKALNEVKSLVVLFSYSFIVI